MMAGAMTVGFPRSREGGHPAQLDAGILARCRAQDPMAFRAFVVRYERMVFALLSRMLGQGPEVEDLAQETFVRAYRAFPAFDVEGPAKPSTWLLTIATRLALDARKKKKLDQTELDETTDGASGSTPELALERRELGRSLGRASYERQRAAAGVPEHLVDVGLEISDATQMERGLERGRVGEPSRRERAVDELQQEERNGRAHAAHGRRLAVQKSE